MRTALGALLILLGSWRGISYVAHKFMPSTEGHDFLINRGLSPLPLVFDNERYFEHWDFIFHYPNGRTQIVRGREGWKGGSHHVWAMLRAPFLLTQPESPEQINYLKNLFCRASVELSQGESSEPATRFNYVRSMRDFKGGFRDPHFGTIKCER